jgi:hypothetical protein
MTYDLFGNGKTALKASGSYYYATKITLANALSGLGGVTLTWGANQNSGACSTTAGASCWQDLNLDGFVQRGELIGTPSSNNANFDINTGIIRATGNIVDKSAKIARTREATVGFSHELFANFAVGADFIYRRYDHGTTNYVLGYQPGAPGFPLSQLYTGPVVYTDPLSGESANYYVIVPGGMRPSGIGNITMTNLDYQAYKGVDITLNKRFSNRWMMNMALTIQNRLDFEPIGGYVDPTGWEYFNGYSSLARYIFKVNGSYSLPWDITASTNLNINDGDNRDLSINGPGQVYGGVNAAGAATTINRTALNFQQTGTTRFERTVVWDIGLHKTFAFNGGRNRIKLMLDGFNVLNAAPVLGYSSNNISTQGTATNPTQPYQRISSVLPPRVFRVGTTLWF